jgi:hypothetical protein
MRSTIVSERRKPTLHYVYVHGRYLIGFEACRGNYGTREDAGIAGWMARHLHKQLDYAEVLQKLGAGNLQLRAPPHLLATRSNLLPPSSPLRASVYIGQYFA